MFGTAFAGLTGVAAWVAGIILKATLVLALAGLITTLLRRASAATRHLVWGGALATLLLLPLLSVSVPWTVPVAVLPAAEAPPPPRAPSPALTSATVIPGAPALSAPARSEVAPPVNQSTSRSRAPLSVAGALTLVWVVGALLFLVQLLTGGLAVRRIVRRAEPLESPEWREPLHDLGGRLAVGRLPRLVMASGFPMPFACGFVRSSIVLPRKAAEWDERRRRAVLCHELAHLRRRDLIVNAVAQLAAAVYWFHPLVWMALRRLRIESERACDDLVLRTGTRASEYADHLLQIVSSARRQLTPAIALPLAHHREFEGRVLAILERGLRRDAPSRLRAGVLALLGAGLVIPLAALVPVRSPVATPPSDVTRATTRQPAPTPSPAPRPDAAPASMLLGKALTREVAKVVPALERELSRATPASPGDTANTALVSSLMGALGDHVAEVRKNAAYALGHLESPAAVPGLAKALASDPDADVREMSGWALGQIQDSSALPALMSAVRSDTSSDVRLISVWALAEIESRAAVPALTDALRDRSADVRERAAWALGTVQPRAAPAPLIAALKDPVPSVRSEAAWALGQIGDQQGVAPLGGLMGDPDPSVRHTVIWALGQLGGEAAQGILVRALQDSDPELRSQAARALGGNDSNPWPQPMPIVR